MPIALAAGAANCDTSQTFNFKYPGDNSMVTIDAQLNGLDPGKAGAAGFDLWDVTSTSAPVRTATTLNSQKGNVPGSIELSYQRPIAGLVTIDLFNWSQQSITGTVTVVDLPSNNAPLQVVSKKAAGSC